MESGGYFLFVLGERANSGTLWSSAPAIRKGGGGRGGKEPGGVRQVEIKRGDRERKKRVRLSAAKLFKLFKHRALLQQRPPEGSAVKLCGGRQTSAALTDC